MKRVKLPEGSRTTAIRLPGMDGIVFFDENGEAKVSAATAKVLHENGIVEIADAVTESEDDNE